MWFLSQWKILALAILTILTRGVLGEKLLSGIKRPTSPLQSILQEVNGNKYHTPSPILANKQPPKLNVVEEDPGLDVGPLMQITIARGEKARLPCLHRDPDSANKISLVLWYRNDTSRPFISYDARNSELAQEVLTGVSWSPVPIGSERGKANEEVGRIFLEDSGQTLSIVDVVDADQAEYRCTVHTSNYPSITHRLKLIVVDSVQRVQLLDGGCNPVGAHVGPFSEGSNFNITCKAFFSCQIVSIEWQMEGKPLQSKWRQPESGVALSTLYWKLTLNHSLATLTCRLICNTTAAGKINASIVDASTTIIMHFMPKVTLLVKSFVSMQRKNLELQTNNASVSVLEGQHLTFLCMVKARPPLYRIVWLHNGRIIGSGFRRLLKQNTSLILSPVMREDAGLYTCLASNREGDGHSNAINLKVNHPPYCQGEKNRTLVTIKNKPVTISCKFSAQPQAMNFSWSFHPSLPTPKPTVKYSPKMQRYTPNPIMEESFERKFQEKLTKVQYSRSRHDSSISLLTFVPHYANQGVICYAKNEVGRTLSPCSFTLKIIDPPDPPENCRAERITSSGLQVTCVLKHFKPAKKNSSELSLPGISYVLSPEAKTSVHLEVWSKKKLLANLTEEQPVWLVQDLPLDSKVLLRIYSASQYARSDFIELEAKPGQSTSSAIGNENGANITSVHIGGDFTPRTSSGSNILILLSSLVGGVLFLLSSLFIALFFIRKKSFRRRENILSEEETMSAPGSSGNLKISKKSDVSYSEIDSIKSNVDLPIETKT